MASSDPYRGGKLSSGAFAGRTPVSASVVAVLRGRLLDRDLELIPQPSRAVRSGDVHEIVLTDQDVSAGMKVGRVAYVAFAEFRNGGVLLAGDRLVAGRRNIGDVVGYDLSHFPNHMNIVVRGRLESGEDLRIRVGDIVEFRVAP